MKKPIASFILLLTFSTVWSQDYVPMKNVSDFKVKVQKTSGKVESIQSEFEQEKHLSVLSEPAKSEGSFYFERGGKVRWEYRTPNQQSIIINDSEVYLIEEGDVQATDNRMRRAYLQMNEVIAGVIHGDAFANDDFSYNFLQSGNQAKVVMDPQASQMSGHIESITLFFNADHYVDKLVITQPGGDFTSYRFFDQTYNEPIPEQVFRPVPLKK